MLRHYAELICAAEASILDFQIDTIFFVIIRLFHPILLEIVQFIKKTCVET
jgi:hypothetical protein